MNFGIDWLSVYCTGVFDSLPPFHHKRQEYSTRQYKYVEFLYFNNDLFATVTHTPHSSILNKFGMIIKIENKYLYTDRFQNILSKFLIESKIKFQGISRLDIFSDFNYFHDQLHPHTFIKRVLNNTYLKNGRSTIKTQGKTAYKIKYDYLRFGTREANSLVYLYNKTKELSEVKNKEYIRDLWKASGLNLEEYIWRLEYSFKPSKHGTLDTDVGEYSHLTIADLTNIQLLREIYIKGINQYFSFKINDFKRNKTRMKDLILLPEKLPSIKLTYIPVIADSTQQAKRIISALMHQHEECNSDYDILKNSIVDTVKGISSKYSLSGYVWLKFGIKTTDVHKLQNQLEVQSN